MDDFGVKYVRRQHAEHIITWIQFFYPESVDWTGELYCGVSLDCNHKNKHVTLFITIFVEVAMNECQHKIQQEPIIHHTNGKYQITGPKLSGKPMIKKTYPTTWRKQLYTIGGRNISILCKRNWPHCDGKIRNIIISKFKMDRRNQTSRCAFNWLLRHKPIWQIGIPFQKNDIAHTQRCIIPTIITR